MQTLLNQTQLPASRFPERADQYICDDCGRDLTRQFHPGRAHVWQSLGRPRFTCVCGKRYVSGAIEWDWLSPREQHRRLVQLLPIGLISGAMIFLFIFLSYISFEHRSIILGIFSFVLVIPLLICVPLFGSVGVELLEIATSIWRTRVLKRFEEQEL